MTDELTLTIDQRIQRINETTEAVKRGFMVIASDMSAIAADHEYLKKTKNGNIKTNRQGETMFDGPRFFRDMEERTGYSRTPVIRFLDAHTAIGNLIDYCGDCKIVSADTKMRLPEAEWQIRPLATKTLNSQPELQAEIWLEVIQEAGPDGDISEKMVRDKVKEKLTPSEPKQTPPSPPVIKTWGNSKAEKKMAAEAMTILKREMSKKYHPDKGGTDDQQKAVNFMLEEFERYFIINPDKFADVIA